MQINTDISYCNDKMSAPSQALTKEKKKKQKKYKEELSGQIKTMHSWPRHLRHLFCVSMGRKKEEIGAAFMSDGQWLMSNGHKIRESISYTII